MCKKFNPISNVSVGHSEKFYKITFKCWVAIGKNRSRVTKLFISLFLHKNLSTLDPSSLASGIAALFDSRTGAKQFASLADLTQNPPDGGHCSGATS